MTETYYTNFIAPLINTKDITQSISFLRNIGVLKSEAFCIGCSTHMKEVKKASSVDKFAFRCYNSCCNKYRTYRSLRTNSFLEDFNIPLNKFIHFIYLYSRETRQKNIIEIVGMSETQIFKILKKIRKQISLFFLKNPIKLGGPNVLVQIDESKFNFNVKAHRGHAPLVPIWVFGIVDTRYQPARGYMQVVEKRDKNTLLPIILKHVIKGSIVHSDDWKAYNSLEDHGYLHKKVCHKYQFVNNENGAHTQHIESYWNRQKFRIKRSKGLKKSVMKSLLEEYMFFDLFSNNLFEAILINLLN